MQEGNWRFRGTMIPARRRIPAHRERTYLENRRTTVEDRPRPQMALLNQDTINKGNNPRQHKLWEFLPGAAGSGNHRARMKGISERYLTPCKRLSILTTHNGRSVSGQERSEGALRSRNGPTLERGDADEHRRETGDRGSFRKTFRNLLVNRDLELMVLAVSSLTCPLIGCIPQSHPALRTEE